MNQQALLSEAVGLHQQGRLAEAEKIYLQVLAADPGSVPGRQLLGALRSQQGRHGEAIDLLAAAAKAAPRDSGVLLNYGQALQRGGRPEEALAAFDQTLALKSDQVEAHFQRGLTLAALRRSADALASYDRTLALAPRHAGALYNRGIALLELKRFAEALASLDAAMAAAPGFSPLHLARGQVLWSLERPSEALESYDRALAIDPKARDAWMNRGFLCFSLRRFDDALASYDKALALDPSDARAWHSRGGTLREMGRSEEALASFDKAVALDPRFTDAYANRAIVLWDGLRRFAPSVADLQRVVALEPDWPYARGELLHRQMQGCDWRGFAEQRAIVDDAVRAGKRAVRPFAYLALAAAPADLLRCCQTYAAAEHPAVTALAPRPTQNKGKIRIGYVSGEFGEHPTAYLMAGVYEQHDRDRLEIIAFDNGRSDGSAMRRRLETAFSRVVDLTPLSDDAAGRAVETEGIDILVNLNGYFGAQRMGLFARRPAPVQINYLGFPGTLGADYIDYIIADRVVIPEDEAQFHSEKIAWLPDSYQANDSRRAIPAAGPTRAQAGLPENSFVFCSFNQSFKLTPDMFAAWMRILKQAEGSVLWLWQTVDDMAANLRRAAAAAGVTPERLLFAPGLPAAAHLARLKLADLFLDCLPCNAHTTASEALWAGLPLLTLRGTTFPGRVAASLLMAAGLPELVAETMADYEGRAIELAREPARLKALRDRLERNRLNSALFDTRRFTRHLERAYETMHDIASRGEAPRSFSVEADIAMQ